MSGWIARNYFRIKMSDVNVCSVAQESCFKPVTLLSLSTADSLLKVNKLFISVLFTIGLCRVQLRMKCQYLIVILNGSVYQTG